MPNFINAETHAYGKVPQTAEDHRLIALRLLEQASESHAENRIAAAQVHATLALTAPPATVDPPLSPASRRASWWPSPTRPTRDASSIR